MSLTRIACFLCLGRSLQIPLETYPPLSSMGARGIRTWYQQRSLAHQALLQVYSILSLPSLSISVVSVAFCPGET